jgi:hypothetical protein
MRGTLTTGTGPLCKKEGCGARLVFAVFEMLVAGSELIAVGGSAAVELLSVPLATGTPGGPLCMVGRSLTSAPPDGPEMGADGPEYGPEPGALGPEPGVEGPLTAPRPEGPLLPGRLVPPGRRTAGIEPLH